MTVDSLVQRLSSLGDAADVTTELMRDDGARREMDKLEKQLGSLSSVTARADRGIADVIKQLQRYKQDNERISRDLNQQITQHQAEKQSAEELRASTEIAYTMSSHMVSSSTAQLASVAARVDSTLTDMQQAQQRLAAAEAKARTTNIALTEAEYDNLVQEVERLTTAHKDAQTALEAERVAHEQVLKTHKTTVDAYENAAETIKEADKAIADATAGMATANNNAAKAAREMEDKFYKLGKGAFSLTNFFDKAARSGAAWIASQVSLASAVKQIYDQTKGEINRGVNVGNDFRRYKDIASLGLNPAEFVQATGEFRRAMLATGGVTESLNTLKEASGEFIDSIADPKERTEFLLQNMDMLAKSGIKPTTAKIKQLGQSMEENRIISGETAAEYMSNIRDITESDSVQARLRMARDADERESILKGIQSRYAEFKALGMTTQQAKAAAGALQDMAKKGAKERLTEGAKLMQMMGAMGVEGGREAYELYNKGTARTKEDDARLSELLGNLSAAVDSAYGGTDGRAFTTEALAQQTGWGPEQLANFSRKLSGDVQKDIKEGAAKEKEKQVSDAVVKGMDTLTQGLSQIANNPFIQGAAGILGSLASAIHLNTGASAANTAALLKGALSNLNPFDDAGGSGSKKKPSIARTAKIGVAGIAASAIGNYVLDGIEESAEKRGDHKTAATTSIAGSALEYGALGATLGSFIPGVGTAVGGGVGAGVGALYGVYNNWGRLAGPTTPKDDKQAAVNKEATEADARRLGILQEQSKINSLATPHTNGQVNAFASEVRQNTKVSQVATLQEQMAQLHEVITSNQAEQSAKQQLTDAESRKQEEARIQQLLKMDDANDHLSVVSDNMKQLVELANKQLIATTLTDKEKQKNRDSIRRSSSGFGAGSYQYI